MSYSHLSIIERSKLEILHQLSEENKVVDCEN
jgi:hypothetical protein